VRKDVDNLFQFWPTVPFSIITHDSFMPSCREGLKQAKWSASPYVHAVELDFVASSDRLSISATITAEACRRQGETGAVGSVIDLTSLNLSEDGLFLNYGN
jgi:hypothetical protein